jgi:hypothetical protein
VNQTEIELEFVRWWQTGADPGRAGSVGKWTLDLGGDKLVLSPLHQRWLLYDAAHGEWVDSGVGPGEAILLSVAGVTGARRALEPGEASLPLAQRVELVASRVIAVLDGELVGPLEPAELRAILAGRPGASVQVWSARHSDWRGTALVFEPEAGPVGGPPTAAPPPRFCGRCGARLESGGRFCGACGGPTG